MMDTATWQEQNTQHLTTALAGIDRRSTAAEAGVAAIAHLDEHHAGAVAHHQVEFADAALRVGGDVLQPCEEQVPACGCFDARTACAAIEAAPGGATAQRWLSAPGHPGAAPALRR